jgi:hypothetical protein
MPLQSCLPTSICHPLPARGTTAVQPGTTTRYYRRTCSPAASQARDTAVPPPSGRPTTALPHFRVASHPHNHRHQPSIVHPAARSSGHLDLYAVLILEPHYTGSPSISRVLVVRALANPVLPDSVRKALQRPACCSCPTSWSRYPRLQLP